MSTTTQAAVRNRAAVAAEHSAATAVVSWIKQIAQYVGGLIAGFVMRRAARRLERLAARHLHALPNRLLMDIGVSRCEVDHVVQFGREHVD